MESRVSVGDRAAMRSARRPYGSTEAERSRRRAEAGRPRPRERGFTLLEVLIALVLFAVLAGISVPYMLRDRPEATARNAADELSSALQLARFRAVAMKRDVYFHFEPSGTERFYTAYVDLGKPGDPPPTGTLEEVGATRIEFGHRQAGRRGTTLPPGISFRVGRAAISPSGGDDIAALQLPVNPLVFTPRGIVEWPEQDQEAWAFVFLGPEDHPEVVRAVGVSRTGAVRSWVLRQGSWQ